MKALPFRLILDWDHCADGVGWHQTSMEYKSVGQGLLGFVAGSGEPGSPPQMVEVAVPVFVERSEQQQERRFELRYLDEAKVVAFVNARDTVQLASFLGGVGFPQGSHLYTPKPRFERADTIHSQQDYFREFVWQAASDDKFGVPDAVNTFLDDFNSDPDLILPSVKRSRRFAEILEDAPDGSGPVRIGRESEFFSLPLNLKPEMEIPERGSAPRVIFRANSLAHFMAMECVLIAAAGASAGSCEVCEATYLYGPLTNRKAKGRFCSEACRQRGFHAAKKAAKAASQI